MLRSVKELIGYKLKALDGEIGKVHDIYFDDVSFGLRYLVADTGTWLEERLTLISPQALEKPDWENNLFPIDLTKEKIENSPSVDTHKPVSLQNETDITSYYGWPAYWSGASPGFTWSLNTLPSDYARRRYQERTSRFNYNAVAEEDIHLRSAKEIIGYKIQAKDDKIGDVEDFIVEDDIWNIRYMVVDTGGLILPGKKSLIGIQWIKDIDWGENKVFVDMTADDIKNSPENEYKK